ncbi:GlsB/YeaQ/YmgE family stress response membrane protein [Candidatus Woesebacteria bacterium]|nr:GlsB/YeaQ/YmgE family stress response membrane protein [Candidatus Woesebacteria bacterium]
MSILYWIVFGLIAGSIADFIAPNTNMGIVGSIILGIIGAVVGGFLGQRFFGVGVTGFNVMSFAVAVLGALLVIFISRIL